MPKLHADSDVTILSRLFETERGSLSQEAAEYFLSVGLSPGDEARLSGLSEKASEGTLTDAEQQEMENYLHVGRILDLLKSKARLSLKANDGASR